MNYKVELTREAASYLRRLDKPTQIRIRRRLHELAENPLDHSKPLTAVSGARSSRVGDYRILFEVYEGRLVVLIFAIGPRGQVYRRL